MKILIAPDSFKDCLSAIKVGEYLKKGISKASPAYEIRIVPMADGGEGTVDSLIDATNGKKISCMVKDPLLRKTEACYGISGDKVTAIIEMASASGIELLNSEQRNPWITTTFGTGELIKDALDKGCRRFICGIGGSATNDGGVGMAMALGVKFLDSDGNEIGFGGGELSNIEKIDLSAIDSRIAESEFIIACDVNNPLTGKQGASYIYGPQKGADEAMVEKLDNNLKHLAGKIKEYLKIDLENVPGSGAAGGLGGGFLAFLNGKLQKGVEIVTEETKLEEHCRWADFVITGEGKIDGQTKFGKTPQGVANMAAQYNVPVIGVAGTLGKGYQELFHSGFDVVLSIVDKPMNLIDALKGAPELLENTGYTIGKMLILK